MSKNVILPSGMEAHEAKYMDFPIPEYNHNPFIQALPPLVDKQEIIKKLTLTPSYKEEERNIDSTYRLHIIQRLYKFFQPLPIHIQIWNMINTSIMQGYIARNPFDKEYKRYVNETGKQIINRTYEINRSINFRTTASSGILIGLSGMGKTTAVNAVLRHIPQIIIHNRYNGQHFSRIQTPHLTLQAPHNSSLKALCLQFFMKIDELLQTNNFKKYVSRNLSVDAMLPIMGQVAQNVGLGILVIDEIQHLQNRGIQQMMNYFVTLMNSFGVSIIFIGTPASYHIFQNELRIARRVSGSGEIIWNNMKNDKEFRFFLESIWRFQWIRRFTSLNDDLIALFYEETQGISDLIVQLFVNAQYLAIESGKEELTVRLIKKVAEAQFRLMKPMLDAIRSGNPYKISLYEDIKRIEITNSSMRVMKEQAITKNEKEKVEIKKVMTNKLAVPGRKRMIKAADYKEDDIRSLFAHAVKSGKSQYQLLLDYGHIDDMTYWREW
ncbi:AAA family ATPase [Brevibacillus brevis]|uniref:AAA family ATPase n=1 Tax=Brevibacillus brevis TaxID=1393 RepID=UPI0037C5318F